MSIIKPFDRRAFLVRSASAVGALTLSSLVTACSDAADEGDFGAAALEGQARRRQAWHTLSAAQKDLYRKAVVALNAESVQGGRPYKTQFQRLAHVHMNSCPHNNWFFLPWHRVYIAFYEAELVRVLGAAGADFALPYWDWTATPTIPAEFWGSDLDPAVLHRGTPFASARGISKSFQFAAENIGPDIMAKLVAIPDFYSFASFPARTTNGPSGRARAGQLESGPHNYIHSTIRGHMGSFLSPLDPVFYLHHANVDRLWNQWLSARADANQDPLPYEGQTLEGVANLRDFWLNFAFTLRADDGSSGPADVLQKGSNVTKEVLDSRSFRVKLRDGSSAAFGATYDSDRPAPQRAAARGSRDVVRVDFTPERIASSDNTFTAKIKTADAKAAMDAFDAGGVSAAMTLLLDNVPMPEDKDVLDSIVLVVRIAEAEVRAPHVARKAELGQIAFFGHGTDMHAAHGSGGAMALDVTRFFSNLKASGAAVVDSVWVSGEFRVKTGVAAPAGWAAWRARLPALLKSAHSALDLALVSS